MPYWGWILVAIVAVPIVAATVVVTRLNPSRRPKSGFGPEYDRTVGETGSRTEAEAELRERPERHEQLDLGPLPPGARAAYIERWRTTQERFVDNPHRAATEADRLVLEVMRARGYPVEGIGQRAADISGDDPELLASYHSAHDVVVRQSLGELSTEDLRNAMRQYRELFDELLGTNAEERLRVR